MTVRAISYGGGVQSTALLVLAAQGVIDFPLAVFANTGDDSEHPDTLRYVREVAASFAVESGIELVEVSRPGETLLQKSRRQKGVAIPMRLPNGAPARRGCTLDFKVTPISRHLKERGASADDPAVVALGISLDEYHRMKRSTIPHQVFVFPLIDGRMDRSACVELIKRAGLPVPPKSACFFCPFSSPARWLELKRNRPDLFAIAADLERGKNDQMVAAGMPRLWLSPQLKPLDEAITETGQLDMFDEGASCDVAGFCAA